MLVVASSVVPQAADCNAAAVVDCNVAVVAGYSAAAELASAVPAVD